jgi:predicted transposase/invertase (TIGR01784 family)
MITDQIFYRLFQANPGILFELLGMPADQAREAASHYKYEAIEFKETAHRSDGFFLPQESNLPLYLVEVQFYRLDSVFADLLVRLFTYLKQNDPAQPFYAVLLFASRSLQPNKLTNYQPYLNSGHIRCFYLDELPEPPNASLGLSIMLLMRQSETEAPATARQLMARAKTEIADEGMRGNLIKLIESTILAKLPHLSWKEIHAMLQIKDLRESRAYQEVRQEGFGEGKKEGLKEGLKEGEIRGRERERALLIRKMAKKKSIQEIADSLELSVEEVQHIIETMDRDSPE